MSMTTRFFSHIRNGLVALGVLAGLSVPAAATPLAGFSRTAVTPATAKPQIVQIHYRRYNCYSYGNCRRYNYWNNDGYYRRHYRPYRRHIYPQFYFGLGVPAYRYVQPRRYYGYRLNSAHVAWCYSRYLSYRQWDNTFQPYHGPRRQCWSPYS
jgi:hypothetical protein